MPLSVIDRIKVWFGARQLNIYVEFLPGGSGGEKYMEWFKEFHEVDRELLAGIYKKSKSKKTKVKKHR